MTRAELARMLTQDEGGAKQVNIAQMGEVLRCLSTRMKGPQGWQIIKTLLASLVLVVLSGCAVLGWTQDAKEKVELLIGDHGAGEYTVTLTKDGHVLHTERLRCDQGPDGKLAGCHRL